MADAPPILCGQTSALTATLTPCLCNLALSNSAHTTYKCNAQVEMDRTLEEILCVQHSLTSVSFANGKYEVFEGLYVVI